MLRVLHFSPCSLWLHLFQILSSSENIGIHHHKSQRCLLLLYSCTCMMHQANKPESSESSIEMVNFLLSSPAPQTQLISLDKLSSKFVASEDDGFYFLRLHDDPLTPPLPSRPPLPPPAAAAGEGLAAPEDEGPGKKVEIGAAGGGEAKNRRKRPRAMKTSEEVESQRMTHIAVERNRRRQMNEHLRVLRSLMPGSYVQRGDQASIIGGAIEFVRELEQLLQCLESQKRRRLLGTAGEAPRAITEVASHSLPFPGGCGADQAKLLDLDPDLIEEMAENKSCLADIEVRVVGFDAMIKILSHRRPAQLIDTIAALEDLQFAILHANVTTIEQTVLYSFNVKIAAESRWTAEDIANSVQQILSFIDASTV